jgi:hypothetical protein
VIRKSITIISLALIFVLFTSIVHAKDKEEDINIQVRFFKGTWVGDQVGLNQVEILSAASHPEIESLKKMAGGPESALKTAIIDALFDIMDLRTVDDLSSFVKTWNGKDASLSEPVMQKPAFAYRFNFIPKRLSPQTVSLQTVIYFKEIDISIITGKDPDKELQRELRGVLASRRYKRLMEKILDKELVKD